MFDLKTIARVLGGDMSGRQVLIPGPGHSARDRSLAIRLDAGAPDGFLVFSHAGDDWQTCRDYVRQKLGLPEWEPGDDRHEQRRIPQSHIDKWDFAAIDSEVEQRRRTEDDVLRIERATKIWNEAIDPRGVPEVEGYLRSRCLNLPDGVAGNVLRFHRHCPWRNENTGRTEFIPCLIAAFRSIDDDLVTGIHRIRVDRPQRWPKTERRMLGLVHGAAVKLAVPGDTLVIGEGIETCLAAMQLGLGPAWALGSVGAISFMPVLDGISRLILLAEAGEASQRAVHICARRWKRAGRRVTISRSEVGSDHNDILMQHRGAA